MFLSGYPRSCAATLIGVPAIIWRMRVNWRDPLGLMFVMLVSVYTFGAMFEQWTYGRVLSPIVLILQISLAAAVARVESKLDYRSLSPSVQRGVYCLIIVLFSLACSAWYFPHILQRSVPGSPSVRIGFAFLSKLYSTIRRSAFRLCYQIDHSNLRREACCIRPPTCFCP